MDIRTNQSSEQKRVLDLIRGYVRVHGKQPSLAYIKQQLGYKHRSLAQYHVNSLKVRGSLEDINDPIDIVEIPLVGSVSCGPALLAEENIEAYIPVEAGGLKKRSSRYFFLRADGDSMNRAEVNPGDYVLVRQESTASINELVVALIGDDATLKKLGRTSDGLPMLVPCSTNPQHKPRIMLEDFSILGIMEKVITPLKGVDV
jgi:repressor LexA